MRAHLEHTYAGVVRVSRMGDRVHLVVCVCVCVGLERGHTEVYV